MAALTLFSGIASAQDDYKYDARGFSVNRESFNQFPWEHIDPLTGNLLLTFSDLKLPGNAGFDLEITRTYNSKDYQWHPAGVGWLMHFGRVFHTPTIAPTIENPTPPPPTWIIEWRDGSQHECYWNSDSSAGLPGPCVTADLWSYDPNARVLYVPNGQIYNFDYAEGGGDPTNPDVPHYATAIRDAFGNRVSISYNGQPLLPGAGVSQIVQTVGTETRTVSFTYDQYGSLATMTALGRTWTYVQSPTTSYRTLTSVSPPAGGSWAFSYNAAYQLTGVSTPLGGHIDYTYQDRSVQDPVDPRLVNNILVVHQRTTNDQATNAAATWTFDYSTTSDVTTVTGPGPSPIVLTYTYTGWPLSGGLLNSVTWTDNGNALQTEQLTWALKAPLGFDRNQVSVNLPLVTQRTISRGPKTFTTAYLYNDSFFNDYGQPREIDENGDFTRTTNRTYRHDFSTYIRGKLARDTVGMAGSLTYETDDAYDTATGFQTGTTKYGITTTFTPDGAGNVATATDADGKTVRYTYDWGSLASEVRPLTTISRMINPDGTVASETKGPATTQFQYDGLERVTLRTPQIGNPVQTVYDDVNRQVRTSRGSSSTTKTLDGFGRPIGTANTVGIQTRITYDPYGRPTSVSYPFDNPNAIPSTSYTYDALGRTLTKTNPDGSLAQYAYAGLDVTITDERTNPTTQHWTAAGDVTDARLASVTDALQKQWVYSYTTLGRVSEVAPPDGAPHRFWTFDSRNLLTSQIAPESGTVSYSYTAAGDVKTRTDANGQVFSYSYDDNHRLTQVAVGTRVTTFGYESGTDNRASATNDDVDSGFTYDPAGRLIQRTDAIAGLQFTTGFGYDGNDNLSTIAYPDTRQITYGYDSENRVTSVTGAGPFAYATNITYHPSGGLTSYQTGNGMVHQMAYDPQRYWVQSIDAGDLHLAYTNYDPLGNVGAINDTRPSGAPAFGSQSFLYDDLNRLWTANGPYGSITYDYDAHGNRSGSAYTYDPATMRLTAYQTTTPMTFSYDPNGNVRNSSGSVLTYTPTNMLETWTLGAQSATYAYDADDLRAIKAVSGAVTSYFLRGPNGEVLTEWQDPGGAGNKTRDYLYLGTRLMAVIEKSGS